MFGSSFECRSHITDERFDVTVIVLCAAPYLVSDNSLPNEHCHTADSLYAVSLCGLHKLGLIGVVDSIENAVAVCDNFLRNGAVLNFREHSDGSCIYEQVEVTKASGDKGVDVIGQVQVGITTITEVVQVKRMQNTITRPYIDQLRGALPYHKAIRGTLITTGKFAAKCAEAALFPGAAPITLIDGDRLLELLIENNVGIRLSNAVELLDVDLQLFDELEMD